MYEGILFQGNRIRHYTSVDSTRVLWGVQAYQKKKEKEKKEKLGILFEKIGSRVITERVG
jgi:hypothetical protein